MLRFLKLMAPPAGEAILDVGGSPEIWREVGYDGPIVFLNIAPLSEGTVLPPGCTFIQGDGRTLPFTDGEFAVVFSNSVVEHVGGWEDQVRFASEIQRVGRRFWVQTPNRLFPLEPHMNFPGFQWLPRPIAKMVVATWPLSYHRRDRLTTEEAWDAVLHTRLVTVAEMQRLFPGATIWRERAFGLTKSVVAYQL